MIPLPTPFGAVVASSGLAVLGTEFKEAKDMNERLIEGAKSTITLARDKIVQSIESMDVDDFDADDDVATTDAKGNTNAGQEVDGVIKVPLPPPDKAGDDDEGDGNKDGDDNNNNHDTPKWLLMNPIEQKRQERLAKEKYRRENQTAFEQTKEYWTKKTGAFLSRNLLPLLKEKKTENKTEESTNAKEDKSKAQIREDEGYVLIGSECDEEEERDTKEKASTSASL
jgi:hypothetical protein